MKICDVCMLYSPHGGGIKTYIDNKIIYFKKKKIKHILIAPNINNPNKIEKTIDGSSTVYYIPCVNIIISGVTYSIFRGFKTINLILKQEKPDVIEIGDKTTTLLFSRQIKKIHNIINVKIFGFSHERADMFAKSLIKNKFISSLIATIFISRFISAVDQVIANSKYTGEEILNFLSYDKLNIVGLGINVEVFNKDKYFNKKLYNQLSDNGRKKIIIHIGRIDKDKKIDLLIDIVSEINPDIYKVLIVGGGSLENDLKKISVVELLGYIPYNNIKKYLAVADLGILVNNAEAFGLVGLEMMAMRLPIIAPNQGGLASYMSSNFAFLCDHNKKSYLDALSNWEKLSKKRKELMGKEAEKVAQKYSIDKMVENLLKVYIK